MVDTFYPDYKSIEEFIECMFAYAKVTEPYDSDNAVHECAVLSILGTMDDQAEELRRVTAELKQMVRVNGNMKTENVRLSAEVTRKDEAIEKLLKGMDRIHNAANSEEVDRTLRPGLLGECSATSFRVAHEVRCNLESLSGRQTDSGSTNPEAIELFTWCNKIADKMLARIDKAWPHYQLDVCAERAIRRLLEHCRELEGKYLDFCKEIHGKSTVSGSPKPKSGFRPCTDQLGLPDGDEFTVVDSRECDHSEYHTDSCYDFMRVCDFCGHCWVDGAIAVTDEKGET